MAKFKFVVLTQPVEGREDEYNDWYQNIHLAQVVDIPGIISAQRFRLALAVSDNVHPYLAIYEIDAPDVEPVIDEIKRRSETGEMFISPSLSMDVYGGVYGEYGALVSA